MICVGSERLVVGDGAVGLATVPTRVSVGLILPEINCGAMKFRCDGTTPAPSRGQDLIAGDIFRLHGRHALNALRVARVGEVDGVLEVSYWLV